LTGLASGQQRPAAPGILVADDDAAIRALLETGLRRRGFTVWVARDGREALDLYQQHADEITLVLLDVRMPVVDGADVLAQLRAWNPCLSAYVMSGHLGGYSEDELRHRGAAGVFEKPFVLPEVVDTLWRAAARLERRAFVRQHARSLRVRSRQGSEGLVKDCSRGGIGLLWDEPAPVRTLLDVRPADAPEAEPWVQVEVKHCQPQGSGYAIGCQFVNPADAPPPFLPY
jgi:CheY-like chemotaxis protein